MNQDPRTRETAAIILQAMKNRRSIRSYTGGSVPKEDLDLIVEAGLTSASGHADYPWDIIVVQDLEIVHKLAGARLGAANMLKTAGAAIVLTADEQFSTWVEDCSVVLTNMHLLADALGYGSCWIQVRMRDAAEGGSAEDYVRSVVKVPEGFRVEAILSIGIPDKEKTPDDAARQAKRAGFAAEKVQYQ